MQPALKRRISRLESSAPQLQDTAPHWLINANKCRKVRYWLLRAATKGECQESARQHLQDRFDDDAPAMIAEYIATRQRVLELDAC